MADGPGVRDRLAEVVRQATDARAVARRFLDFVRGSKDGPTAEQVAADHDHDRATYRWEQGARVLEARQGPDGRWVVTGPVPDELDQLVADIVQELERARTAWPGYNPTLAAMAEEVGELAQAMLEEPRERVRAEAIQVAVVAMRVVLDGDQTLDRWRESHGLDELARPHEPEA